MHESTKAYKRLLSVVLLVAICIASVPSAYAAEVSEDTMDTELRSRGYPQTYLDCIPSTVKESLYNKPNLEFEGATVSCYNEDGSYDEYDISADGAMALGQIPVADLTFVIGVARYSNSGNVLITFSYEWNNIPVNRYSDVMVVSWDPEIFELMDSGFHRYDKYNNYDYNGIVYTDDPGYYSASNCDVSWRAELCKSPDVISLYGHGEFLLAPKVSTYTNTFYAYYIHAKKNVNISVSLGPLGSLSFSTGEESSDKRGIHRIYTFPS